MKQNWNLALKNKKADGQYNIAIRYYENGKERYFDTDYRATREDWYAASGRAYREMESIRATLKTRIKQALDAIEAAGQDPSFELFKEVWNGKSISTERSWITLMDKYLEMKEDRFKFGTKRIYNYTRTLLVRMEAMGFDLSLGSFTREEDYQRLEKWFTKVAKIGRTSLGIHMQNIKTIANVGYDPRKGICWLRSDAYKFYRKPARKVGTHPNTLEQLKKIKNFDVTEITSNTAHANAYAMGRDFWCWMVLCGGMEARSVAKLRWTNVHKDCFTFERAKTENAASGGTEVVISTDVEMTQYMFDVYGVRNNPHGYVFPVLKKGMSEAEEETAINLFAAKITRNVQVVAKRLGITPLPTCKRTRPTFAVLSNELGMDIREQQQMMGHKKVSTTEIYMTHLPTPTKIAVSKRFADAVKI